MPFSRLMHQWHIHVVGSPLVFESTLFLYPLRAIVTIVIANPDFHHPVSNLILFITIYLIIFAFCRLSKSSQKADSSESLKPLDESS